MALQEFGDLVNAVNGLKGAAESANNPNRTPAQVAADGLAASSLLTNTMGLLNSINSAVPGVPVANGFFNLANLEAQAALLDQAIANGDNEAIIKSSLDLASALAGALGSVPSPYSPALKAASLALAAASALYQNREALAEALNDLTSPNPNLPDKAPLFPLGDANNNGIPDIHEGNWIKPDPKTKTWWDRAKDFILRRDPLTFDLDNDGLETVGISSTNPILFDHDGDGTKNGTGWVKADDAMLVLDRNGNGTIDSGRELFGDNTIKSNGQTAEDGFDALADLDSNADGIVDNQDAQFANLRLWRDLNQDGISQTGELFTLNELGIVGINVASTVHSTVLANGNQLTDTGSFIKADGSTGTVGEVTGNLGDINLAEDTFHRQFADHLDTTTVANLPDMQGSGAVRDLREAATQSTTLQNLLTQYSAATTREGQMALIDQLLDAWADTSGYAETYDDRVAGLHYQTPTNTSVPYVVSYDAFGSITNATYQTGVTNTGSSGSGSGGVISIEVITPEYQALINSWNQKIHILEAFNGNYFFGLPTQPTQGAKTGITFEAANDQGGGVMISAPINIRYDQSQLDLLQQSYDALKASVYDALLLQTRFKPLLDDINLVIDANGISLDFTQLTNIFNQGINSNAEAGLLELIDFNFATKDLLKDSGWAGWSSMTAQLELTQTPAINEALKLNGAMVKNTMGFNSNGTTSDDVIVDDSASDNLSGGSGNDILFGLAGNDNLSGDTGNDVLDGGTGDDTMSGGEGSDTYVVRTGSGQDVINNINNSSEAVTDTLQFADIASTGLTSLSRQGSSLIIGYGNGDSVKLQYQFYGDSSYQVTQFKFSDGVNYTFDQLMAAYPIALTDGNDSANFTSGNVEIVHAGAGDDTVSTFGGDDVIDGEAGNDYLNGGDGNDTLYGGSGNDNLSGDTGNDVLDGGTGDDTMSGGEGSDTYVVRTGSGQDVINNINNSSEAVTDTLQFADIASTGLTSLSRQGSSLIIGYGNGDSVKLQYQFYGDSSYQVTQFKFSDGVNYTFDQLMAAYPIALTDGNDSANFTSGNVEIVHAGAGDDTVSTFGGDDVIDGEAGNDYLNGGDGNDTLYGGSGNDNLSGDTGNDVLDGGTGDDTMSGGEGSDTYVVRTGSGQDVINNINNSSEAVTDTLQFADIASTGLTSLSRQGSSLIIGYGNGDSVKLQYQFYGDSSYQVTQFKFSDGVNYTFDQLMAAYPIALTDGNDSANFTSGNVEIVHAGAGDDTVSTFGGDDVIDGEAGNDYLNGGDGNDTLYGGSGNDNLSGDTGNDVLDGGTGDDTMSGGEGSDTYVVRTGSGQDVINNINNSSEAVTDTLQFADIASTGLTSLSRQGSSLIIGYGNGDSVKLQYQFYGDSSYQVTQFKFSDGVNYTFDQLMAAYPIALTDGNDSANFTSGNVEIVHAGAGDDTVSTFGGDDVIDGEAGNDYLNGGDGNDTLYGGSGNDNLSGDTGNDVLDGGTGDDTMSGGEGSDTYVVRTGSGQDVINNINNSSEAVTDTLQFADIASTGLTSLSRQGSSLIIGYGNGDSVKLQYQFYGDSSYQVTQFKFSDGVNYTFDQLMAAYPIALTDGNDSANFTSGNVEIVHAGAGDDTVSTFGGDDVIDGEAGNDYLNGGDGNDTLYGGSGNDNLSGDTGNDVLDGGTGDDTMSGGEGSDTYVVRTGSGQDVINNINNSSEAVTDTLQFADIASTGLTSLSRQGSSLIIGYGNGDSVKLQYQFYGDSSYQVTQFKFSDGVNYTFDQLMAAYPIALTDGNDSANFTSGNVEIVHAGAGDDTVSTFGGDDVIDGEAGNDYLNGGDGNDTLYGGSGNDNLSGDTGNDVLDGGTGDDTMSGGEGNDTYTIDVLTDVITENLNEGTDLVNVAIATASGTYTVAANVENATLINTVAYSLIGNALDNILIGNAAVNTLNGDAGNDILDGGTGADTMKGGKGNDTYIVDNVADIVSENLDEGTDTVQSSATYLLTANIENLTLTGNVAINGVGNALDNIMIGNSANNTLNGAAGADTMIGGLGNDTYTIDMLTDVVTENLNEGTDLVNVAIATTGGAYTVAANVENATLTNTVTYSLTGNALDNILIGNAAVNTLNGGAGNDTLNGLAGSDTMIGGLGNDIYTIDVLTDVITENLNEGTDLVNVAIATASGTYTVAANVENATLTNTVAYSLTGNVLDNVLTGNAAANTLDGGAGNDTLNGLAGNDTMIGGLGNDTYTIDALTDVVTENLNEGTDLVNVAIATASGTYTVAANVENANLVNSVAYTLSGNELNNVLTGNAYANTLNGLAGNDTLNGGAGVDTLVGGDGDDTYIVDTTTDVITEADTVGAGVDTVQSSVTYVLGATSNLENLTLTGTTAINATGNALANFMKGNSANNTITDTAGGNDILQAFAGNDTFNDTVGNNLFDGGLGNDLITAGSGRDIIIGGQGNDTITTGTGYDVIVFNKGDGQDIINASTGADNTISLGGNFAYSDLSLTKSTNDLILKMGASDQITLKNWYLTSPTNKSVINLQVVAEAIQGFTLGGTDDLRNNKIENFNFSNLVAAFDTAGATANWQLTDARLTTHLTAGSDTAAIGGDLAYQYGNNSNLTGMGLLNAQSVIAAASFGQTAQTLSNPTVWQAEVAKLG